MRNPYRTCRKRKRNKSIKRNEYRYEQEELFEATLSLARWFKEYMEELRNEQFEVA